VATSWEDPTVSAGWEDDGSTHCSILNPAATSTDNILGPKMQENHCGWVEHTRSIQSHQAKTEEETGMYGKRKRAAKQPSPVFCNWKLYSCRTFHLS